MDMLRVFLVGLLGVVSCRSGLDQCSVSEVTVSPGGNITLYCDCKTSSEAYKIVWFRNCSHENQPTLVLKLQRNTMIDSNILNQFPRIHLVKNQSSYDLLITNISDSDEGLYYCGTEQKKVDDSAAIKHVYRYGNVTRIILYHSQPDNNETPQHRCVCWTLLFSLCPAVAVLTSLLSSLLVYLLCQKKAKELQADEKRSDTRASKSSGNQDGDVCYAALEIRQASQKPKKKKTQTDLSTYSAIRTRT
ncbi:uncharacterized protein LOC108896450 isoform X1 [Lates calcarifer]|uniref:Uncharacterized protein LOC108896450 isoform X1 n=1 Tax=Lates calcarifer TaxID=8187 RepID=A0AAJ8DPH0_LATCA|nr:uncharacterized protein LOC108896450 isoform X1 [Lates calcarifer]